MKCFSILLLIVLSSALAPAQELTPQKEKEKELQRLQLRAVSMIEQTAAEAMFWDDPKAAAAVLTDAAELRWPETPGMAAKWLLKAWDDAAKVGESTQDQRLKELATRSDKADLQARVLRVANKYDPKMAEKFIKQLSSNDSGMRTNRAAFDDRSDRSEQLLRMAAQAVDSDPDLAFNLAVNSLTDGVSQSLQGVLTSLRVQRPELANKLFDLALTRFSSGAPDPSEAEVLAGYLFSSGITYTVNSAGRTVFIMNPSQQKITPGGISDPQRARSFLAAAYQEFFSRPIALDAPQNRIVAQRILAFGKRMTPRYTTLTPEFVQPLQTFLAQLETQLYPPSSASETKNETTKPRTREEMYQEHIADLEAQAEKEMAPEARKLAYAKAAVATRPDDYERGKAIADKIDDDSLRADVGSFVLYRAALSFLGDKDLQKPLDIAPKIDDAARKAVVKIVIARALIKSKPNQEQTSVEQQQAFDLLVDVGRELLKQEPTPKIVKIMMGRTAVLADVDKSGVSASLEQIVPMINKIERFDLRDGASPELGLSVPLPVGRIENPRVGFDFRSAIDPLVTTEFEQISGTVERLQAKDVRGVARFEVAKWFLEKNPPLPKAAKKQSQ